MPGGEACQVASPVHHRLDKPCHPTLIEPVALQWCAGVVEAVMLEHGYLGQV